MVDLQVATWHSQTQIKSLSADGGRPAGEGVGEGGGAAFCVCWHRKAAGKSLVSGCVFVCLCVYLGVGECGHDEAAKPASNSAEDRDHLRLKTNQKETYQ